METSGKSLVPQFYYRKKKPSRYFTCNKMDKDKEAFIKRIETAKKTAGLRKELNDREEVLREKNAGMEQVNRARAVPIVMPIVEALEKKS